ncbi:alpha-methylacyl-CoA racemase [Capronia epimyces CBS 606.96]|uniref:Alpha-methylacyl-CoA racemase n=1 Tax=Capronia epimyces CBS 606.96 TaxID=1182542 RepID=W9YPW8_9EURO|nr:alpha-methylacyl-CoA racemase [Capronia epimyces CBS 606.96]EXJ91715.1 alpha-methylacyl-CoA racemase [Capronia epimyces CBS 606.96]
MEPPPLSGIKVLEFAGLAPGPFAGLLCADWGASVLRVDRAVPGAHSHAALASPPPATSDRLTRRKSSICVDLKRPDGRGLAFIKDLAAHVDVVIDPFRPGVLEKLGLAPQELLSRNPRLIIARMTGFRRDGKYSAMAGHDINYIAVSGVLSMLGRKGERPQPALNLLGDFAGGGAVCFLGIVLALLSRATSGKGQVVEANMVDGSAFLATMPRLALKTPLWSRERGTNVLDGGCPYYQTYETADGRYMAVGALEPQFFAALLKGLSLKATDLPGARDDRAIWPDLFDLFTKTFKSKTREAWEHIFDGTDACVTPMLTQQELELSAYIQKPIVTLRRTPGLAIATKKDGDGDADPGASQAVEARQGQGQGVEGEGWISNGLSPSKGGEEVLQSWLGWRRGHDFDVDQGGLVLTKVPVANPKL